MESIDIDIDALLATLPARFSEILPRGIAAAHDPQHVVLIEDERRLDAAAFVWAIDTTALQLSQAGVQGGDRVMIVAENSVAQVVLMFAAAKLDAWALLTNARLSASRNRRHPRSRETACGRRFTVEASKDARRITLNG